MWTGLMLEIQNTKVKLIISHLDVNFKGHIISSSSGFVAAHFHIDHTKQDEKLFAVVQL